MSSSYVESLRVRSHCVARDAAAHAVDEVIDVRLTTNSGLLGAGAFVAVVEAILARTQMSTSGGVLNGKGTAKYSMFDRRARCTTRFFQPLVRLGGSIPARTSRSRSKSSDTVEPPSNYSAFLVSSHTVIIHPPRDSSRAGLAAAPVGLVRCSFPTTGKSCFATAQLSQSVRTRVWVVVEPVGSRGISQSFRAIRATSDNEYDMSHVCLFLSVPGSQVSSSLGRDHRRGDAHENFLELLVFELLRDDRDQLPIALSPRTCIRSHTNLSSVIPVDDPFASF